LEERANHNPAATTTSKITGRSFFIGSSEQIDLKVLNDLGYLRKVFDLKDFAPNY
jgi:hypothetical protein